jgi:hypothetical protein
MQKVNYQGLTFGLLAGQVTIHKVAFGGGRKDKAGKSSQGTRGVCEPYLFTLVDKGI